MRSLLLAAALVAMSPVSGPAQSPSPVPSPVPLASAAMSAPPSPAASSAPRPAATTLSEFARARVDTTLRSGHADAAWFSSQVPAAQVDAIVAQLKASLGEYKSIDGTQGDYTAHFEKGTDEVLVPLDADNKIDGLLFKPPKLQTSSLDDALRALRSSSGKLSYVVIEGRSEVAARDPSAPLAVGSAFKLAVLAGVRDEIARGRRHWSDVVPLKARWKSLSTGVICTWPDGTPITLATYATEMISISDNTAADALVRLAGPQVLAPYAMRNTPFLTTREWFVLKSTPGAMERVAYLAARTSADRAVVLRAVDKMPLPVVDALVPKPFLDIEWHYNVRELCDLMGRVADLPLMSINPGAADPASFRHVAFKGGFDFGVVNLTTQVTTKRGTSFCFSATLNDPAKAVDDTALLTAYGSVLSVLANR
jgi:hypothetical protein